MIRKRNLKYRAILAGMMGLALILTGEINGESVAKKSAAKRIELTKTLRSMRPIVFNFPCDPLPECRDSVPPEEQKKYPWERTKLYREAKTIFQEGLMYHYEGQYVNAYNRFLDAQVRLESLLEELSQSYLDRTEMMLRESIEQKNPEDSEDKSVVDISMELGPNSKLRRDFKILREAGIEERRYDPRLYHYAQNKYDIEANMAMGYKYLGMARDARVKALKVGQGDPPHIEFRIEQRRKRIEYYLDSIQLARRAKFNAERIYQLKYPYDNYALYAPDSMTEKVGDQPREIPVIDGIKMEWDKNPYLMPKKLHPILDLRVPEKFRVDTVDIRNMRYDDEKAQVLEFKHLHSKPTPVTKVDTKNGGGGAGGAAAPAAN